MHLKAFQKKNYSHNSLAFYKFEASLVLQAGGGFVFIHFRAHIQLFCLWKFTAQGRREHKSAFNCSLRLCFILNIPSLGLGQQ